jgi:AcrR family transcriptional regulator
MTENWHKKVKNKNREELIAAGKKLFMNQSFLSVNIKDVCDMASVSRVTFYKHFQSMDELIFEVQMELLGSMTEFVAGAPSTKMNGREKLASMLHAWVEFACQYPQYIKFIILFDLHYEAYDSNQGLTERYENFVRGEKERHFLIDALESGIQDGSLKPDIEPLDTAHFIFTTMMGLLQKLSLTPKNENSSKNAEIPSRFVNMLVQYLSTEQ